jgi:hypothetical protein
MQKMIKSKSTEGNRGTLFAVKSPAMSWGIFDFDRNRTEASVSQIVVDARVTKREDRFGDGIFDAGR